MQCPLLPPGHSICLWIADCQFTKREACVRPYLFASDGLPKSRAKGTARQPCIASLPHPALLLHQSYWPATDMSNNFLSACRLLRTHRKHTHTVQKKHVHTPAVTGYLGMYKTWACTCARTHIFYLHSLVGSLPGLQQSLTEETEDFPSWATFYQL